MPHVEEPSGGGAVLTDGVVTLRPVERADAEALVDAVRSSLHLLTPWMVWATDAYGRADAHAYLDEVEQGGERAFKVVDGGRLQGMCGLNKLDALNRTANLGYWLRAEATGAGRATRAARLVAIHGLRDLALERVEVLLSVHNAPSRGVPERLGFIAEGIRRRALRVGGAQHDAHVFAAFPDDLPRLLDAPPSAPKTGPPEPVPSTR